MARVKLTKNELKVQRDALKRFQRYLPTLQLKKQQLQMEMRQLTLKVTEKREEEDALRINVREWVHLYAEEIEWDEFLVIREVRRGQGNIAGVNIPVFEGVDFEISIPDLWNTPPWIDKGIEYLRRLIGLRMERRVLEEQYRLLAEELRTTNQRVNLFEKVKIPESKENIRVIRIYMGDQMTAGVARSKIAKGKANERKEAMMNAGGAA